jgi:hypothetical protein
MPMHSPRPKRSINFIIDLYLEKFGLNLFKKAAQNRQMDCRMGVLSKKYYTSPDY